MISNPPIDELTEKAGDKYSLCCVIAKRARNLAKTPTCRNTSKQSATPQRNLTKVVPKSSKDSFANCLCVR